MFDTIVAAIMSSTVVTGMLIWLTKSWISERLQNSIRHEYDQKLESYKSQLKYQTDSELERIKADLQIEAAKRNIQFSKIFDDIANTVAEVYSKLGAFKDSVGDYVNIMEWPGGPSKEERRKIVGEKMNEFLEYYKSRKIYLPEATAEKVDVFWQGLYEISIDFMYGVEQGGDERRKDDKDTWSKAYNYMSKHVPSVLKALEKEFRNILGVDIALINIEQKNPSDR
jgi:hypothetical protein